MDISAHLDLDSLETLRDIMEEEFDDLIQLFLCDGGRRLPAMMLAWETRNTTGLRMEAHSFKGSSANICAARLSNLNTALENRLRDHLPNDIEWQEIHDQIAAIDSEFGLVKKYFMSLLPACSRGSSTGF